jgi:hypothetical protein
VRTFTGRSGGLEGFRAADCLGTNGFRCLEVLAAATYVDRASNERHYICTMEVDPTEETMYLYGGSGRVRT